MQLIENGDEHSSPELDAGDVKVVVIGEPQVGKTSFIRAFYDHHEPAEIYHHDGARVYPCEFNFNGVHGRAEIIEIPVAPDFGIDPRTSHYEDANAIVLMYAIDDPLSLQVLTDKWLPEAKDAIISKSIPVVVVGNKDDLRDDQEAIEGLTLDADSHVTYEEGEHLRVYEEKEDFCEISTSNLEEVNNAFNFILNYALFHV